MAAKKSAENTDRAYDDILALQLDECVGEELAEKLAETVCGITAGMTRSDAIAKAMTEKAIKGDNAAAKFLFEMARRKEEKEKEIPFAVELKVIDNGV